MSENFAPTLESAMPGRGAALVIAHPGHEMRVHAWLEQTQPLVFVLTDGSGHGDHGRIDSTAEVLRQAGAAAGSIFGRLSDREAYALIFDQRLEELKALVLELSAELENARVHSVICDAVEGFNPVHDLCHVVAESAVRLASSRLGCQIKLYDFWLEAAPDAPGDESQRALRIELTDRAFERKMEAAKAYGALREEVERAMEAHGSAAFGLEVVRSVEEDLDWYRRVGGKPFYEIHGERRVAEGIYTDTIRFQEHFLPLAEALRTWSAH